MLFAICVHLPVRTVRDAYNPNDSTTWSEGRPAGFRCDFEDFSLPSSYSKSLLSSCRVVFKMLFCFPFRWLGLDLDGFFSLPCAQEGTPIVPTPRGWPNLLRGRSLAVRVGNFFQGCSTKKDGFCLMVHKADIQKFPQAHRNGSVL